VPQKLRKTEALKNMVPGNKVFQFFCLRFLRLKPEKHVLFFVLFFGLSFQLRVSSAHQVSSLSKKVRCQVTMSLPFRAPPQKSCQQEGRGWLRSNNPAKAGQS
jgi:hypothetical protein